MSEMPTPPDNISLVTYADDCSIISSDRNINTITTRLNPYLNELNTWFTSRNLELSIGKSMTTLFTNWTKEVNNTLSIKINGLQKEIQRSLELRWTICSPSQNT